MQEIRIDLLTVLIAALINMVVGFVWYSKWLFGTEWMKHYKISEQEMKKHGFKPIIYEFLSSLVIAYFLTSFEACLSISNVTDGMFVGFCAWLGFVATTQISNVIWSKLPLKLFFIATGAKLLSYVVMGGVIAA